MRTFKELVRLPFALRARYRDAALARRDVHDLTVAAIFREEAPFLDEWLEFHAAVGVSQFYLYNNFSTDDFREVLAPWIARGLVTLHDWPVEVGQLPAYRHCVRHYADAARWIAFIDVDEYLFSPAGLDIRPILARYRDLPGLHVHSPYFGSAGRRARPEGSLVQGLTMRAPLSCFTSKTIANPRWIYDLRNVHTFKYWAGEALDTARRRLGDAAPPALDLLRLNHYWSRSLDDLETKVQRGDASRPDKRDLQWHLDFEANLNAEEDTTIVPIARAVAERREAAPASA